ncbi:MAG: hypothetical protein M3447_11115, partial [Acidobacteriota bacterium]|nr:hypothetical protein [Acidobacteriota bacterium]
MTNKFALLSRFMYAFACAAMIVIFQSAASAQVQPAEEPGGQPPDQISIVTQGSAQLSPMVAYQEEDGTSNVQASLQITDDGTT